MARIAESELIINGDGSIFHLHILPEDLADIIILVGDPGRVDLVSTFFDKNSIEVKKSSREFNTITGKYKGKRVSVISTGIGTDNIDIVMTELDALANIDFKTREPKKDKKRLKILRVGTCGAVQPDIPLGGFIFSHISIGFDGLLNWYAGRDIIALKGIEDAFVKHMGWNEKLPAPYFVKASDELIKRFDGCTIKGMTVSAPGFYGPQGRSVRLPLLYPDLIDKLESFKYEDRRVTNIEMEGSALAGLATLLGHDAGTVCCAIANRHAKESQPDYKPYILKLVELSLDKVTE
ncbi:MAG: nucleoside phosphorylase [Bacteroidales bacterium]|nr:nucleoside phosphorylase [Bacteroidales bacterium]